MNNKSFFIILGSLGFLCLNPVFIQLKVIKKKNEYGEEIPKLEDPHLILQFGCPKENPLTK